jgi:chemotaxis family two-component system response regulator Rcp1
MNTTQTGAGTASNVHKPQTRMTPTPNASRGEPIEVLLVEDSPDDADLTIDALRNGRVRNRITHVEDGVAAMAVLRREGKYADAPRPDLILLDLNLPRKSGREVLAEVKQDPDLRRIPVVIMTSSDDEKDILAAYNLYVNCYVTKPVDLDQFIGVVKSIEQFWFSIVKLPAA